MQAACCAAVAAAFAALHCAPSPAAAWAAVVCVGVSWAVYDPNSTCLLVAAAPPAALGVATALRSCAVNLGCLLCPLALGAAQSAAGPAGLEQPPAASAFAASHRQLLRQHEPKGGAAGSPAATPAYGFP
eukprot:gene56447-17253_t